MYTFVLDSYMQHFYAVTIVFFLHFCTCIFFYRIFAWHYDSLVACFFIFFMRFKYCFRAKYGRFSPGPGSALSANDSPANDAFSHTHASLGLWRDPNIVRPPLLKFSSLLGRVFRHFLPTLIWTQTIKIIFFQEINILTVIPSMYMTIRIRVWVWKTKIVRKRTAK